MSVNEADRSFGIRLEIGQDEYKRPEIMSLLCKGNLFSELTTMPPPVLNHEG
jgi:hypothetical protein